MPKFNLLFSLTDTNDNIKERRQQSIKNYIISQEGLLVSICYALFQKWLQSFVTHNCRTWPALESETTMLFGLYTGLIHQVCTINKKDLMNESTTNPEKREIPRVWVRRKNIYRNMAKTSTMFLNLVLVLSLLLIVTIAESRSISGGICLICVTNFNSYISIYVHWLHINIFP